MIPFLKEFFVRQFRLGSETGPLFVSGTGSPEGVVTAPVGSEYKRTNGGVGTTMYSKETGAGNTGWVAISSGGGGGGTPGGPTNAIQYNTGSAFGGEAAFTYDSTSDQLVLLDADMVFNSSTPGLRPLQLTSQSMTVLNDGAPVINVVTEYASVMTRGKAVALLGTHTY